MIVCDRYDGIDIQFQGLLGLIRTLPDRPRLSRTFHGTGQWTWVTLQPRWGGHFLRSFKSKREASEWERIWNGVWSLSQQSNLWALGENVRHDFEHLLITARTLQSQHFCCKHSFGAQFAPVQILADSPRKCEHCDLCTWVHGTLFYPAGAQVGHGFRVASPP